MLPFAPFILMIHLLSTRVASVDEIEFRNFSVPLRRDAPMPKFGTSGTAADGLLKENRTLLKILVSAPYSGEIFAFGPLCTESSTLALDQLKNIPNWLPGYEVVLEFLDDKYDETVVVNTLASKLIEEDVTSRFPLAIITDSKDVPQIISALMVKPNNYVAMATYQLSIKQYKQSYLFKNFYAMGERTDVYYMALALFMQSMNWTRVAIISEVDSYIDMMDLCLLDQLELHNISVAFMSKVSSSENSEEMADAMKEMKWREPRIIISQSYMSSTVACWLHKYGMFGPNYVVAMLGWNDFDEHSEPTESVADWCDKSMIFEVLSSVFFYADIDLSDAYGSSWTDQIGMTKPKLYGQLQQRIVEPEKMDGWFYAPSNNYDRVLVAGLVLNETERLLRLRSETLSDWFTSGDKFKTNGSEIAKVIKQAFANTKVIGMTGKFNWDQTTGISTGSQPVIFYQVRTTETWDVYGNVTMSSERVGVAFYDSSRANNDHLVMKAPLVWKTVDKLVPKDHLEIALIPGSLWPTGFVGTAYFLIAAAILGCFILIFSAVTLHKKKKITIDPHDFIIAAADILMISHVFAVPSRDTDPPGLIQCSISSFLVLIGYSILIIALPAKAILDKKGSASLQLKYAITYVVFVAINVALLTTAIATGDGSDFRKIVTEPWLLQSTTTNNLAYRNFRWECDLMLGHFMNSTTAIVLFSILLAVHVAAHVGAVMVVVMETLKKRMHADAKSRSLEALTMSMALYCHVLVMIGGIFVIILQPGNGQFVSMVCVFLTLLLALINMTFLIIAKFKKPSISPAVGVSGPAKPGAKHQQSKSKKRTNAAMNSQNQADSKPNSLNNSTNSMGSVGSVGSKK